MLSYQRDISTRLWLLRTLLVIIITVFLYCIFTGKTNGAYFIGIMFLAGSFFSVKGLSFDEQLIQIKKFYLFGLSPIQHELSSKEVELFSFYDKDELLENTDPTILLGCLFFLCSVQAKYQGFFFQTTK